MPRLLYSTNNVIHYFQPHLTFYLAKENKQFESKSGLAVELEIDAQHNGKLSSPVCILQGGPKNWHYFVRLNFTKY